MHHADGAVAVRRPADRRCDRGARKHRAPRRSMRQDATARPRSKAPHEIGLAVLATTFSIVAVFLPVGFMGGIIGRFFHQFGITVSAAVLISMFVSFTLDPMLSSIWPDPARRHGDAGRLYAAASAACWHGSTRVQWLVATSTRRCCAGRWPQARRWRSRWRPSSAASRSCRPDRHRVRAAGRLSAKPASRIYTPVGSSLEFTETKAAPGRGGAARISGSATTPTPRSTPATRRARTRRPLRAPDAARSERKRTRRAAGASRCATGCARSPASRSRTSASPAASAAATSRSSCRCRAPI